MKRFVLIVGLALGLSACAGVTEPLGMKDPFAIAQPFQGLERNDEMIAQAIEVPALVVEVPQGLAAEVATALRDQVVAAWKHVEAAKLAEKKAKELVTEAEAAAEPFDAFFTTKGYEVKTTELFSRRRYSVSPGLGNPPEEISRGGSSCSPKSLRSIPHRSLN